MGSPQEYVEKAPLADDLPSPPSRHLVLGVQKALDLDKDGATNPLLPIRIPCDRHIRPLVLRSRVGSPDRNAFREISPCEVRNFVCDVANAEFKFITIGVGGHAQRLNEWRLTGNLHRHTNDRLWALAEWAVSGRKADRPLSGR